MSSSSLPSEWGWVLQSAKSITLVDLWRMGLGFYFSYQRRRVHFSTFLRVRLEPPWRRLFQGDVFISHIHLFLGMQRWKQRLDFLSQRMGKGEKCYAEYNPLGTKKKVVKAVMFLAGIKDEEQNGACSSGKAVQTYIHYIFWHIMHALRWIKWMGKGRRVCLHSPWASHLISTWSRDSSPLQTGRN